jgi:hypothetical protein
MMITPQVENIKYPRTLLYGKRNYGKAYESEYQIGVDLRKKSCTDNFHGVINRLSIDIQDGLIRLYNTSPDSVNSNCLTSVYLF